MARLLGAATLILASASIGLFPASVSAQAKAPAKQAPPAAPAVAAKETVSTHGKLTVRETVLGKINSPADLRSMAVFGNGQQVAIMSRKVVKGPDGKDVDKYVVTADGKESKPYTWIVANSVQYTADGATLLCIVQEGDKMHVVVNGNESKPYHEIVGNELFVSPQGNRYAFFAKVKASSRRILVVDGEEGKEFDQIGRFSFSPDGKRVAFAAESGEKRFFVVDNAPGKDYDKLDAGSFTWSPDSKHFAYRIIRDNNWVMVVDGKELPTAYQEATPLVFSPDSQHQAYVVRNKNKMSVVLDGKEQKAYDIVALDSLRFSPDSKRLAYLAGIAPAAAKAGSPTTNPADPVKLFYVVDGQELRSYTNQMPGNFLFSPDSKRTAYLVVKPAGNSRKYAVVIDGIEGKEYEDLRLAQFSPDSKRFAYLGLRDKRVYAVEDNSEGAGYSTIANLVFSPDSKQVAFIAGRDRGAFLVLNGIEKKEYLGGIVADTIVFSPDGKHIAYEAKRTEKGTDKPVFVINDMESPEHGGTVRGSRPVFDGPSTLRAMVLKEKAGATDKEKENEIVRMQIDIAQ